MKYNLLFSSLLAKLRWLDKHIPSAAEQCQTLLFGGYVFLQKILVSAAVEWEDAGRYSFINSG